MHSHKTYTFKLPTHEKDACPNTSSSAFLVSTTIKVAFAKAVQSLRKTAQTSPLFLVDLYFRQTEQVKECRRGTYHRELKPQPVLSRDSDLRNAPPRGVNPAHDLVQC